MDILVSNDDGIDAPGIAALAEVASAFGTVWVVAPDRERSAQSQALTMHQMLRVNELGPRRFSVSGTPADCVYLAVHHLLPRPPSIVLSGVNNGSNIGNDVFYSGTVAAAMEACLAGYPAIAFSLHRGAGASRPWATAEMVARRLIADVLADGLPPRTMLNVNVPDVEPAALRGVRAAVLGRRRYHALVDRRLDPRGRPYYWIGGDHAAFESVPGSDGPLVEQGFATFTPLQPDHTARDTFDRVAVWGD
jgi:5'-nucleotidase